jgi:hypothetical protein
MRPVALQLQRLSLSSRPAQDVHPPLRRPSRPAHRSCASSRSGECYIGSPVCRSCCLLCHVCFHGRWRPRSLLKRMHARRRPERRRPHHWKVAAIAGLPSCLFSRSHSGLGSAKFQCPAQPRQHEANSPWVTAGHIFQK